MIRHLFDRFHLRAGALAGILLVGCLLSGSASAQWMVQDPLLIAKTVAEYKETAKRWKSEYDHYQQQLIKLKQLNFQASQFVDNFPERDLSYGMDTTCPGSKGIEGGLQDAFRQLAPNKEGNIVDEQRKICQRIVLSENAKYNETIKMLKTLIRRQQEYQYGVESQRASVGDSQGALAANDNETQRFLARTSMDIDYWQARMTAYDKYIESLKWDSDRLAKCAMRGCKTGVNKVIGDVVRAAALEVALHTD
jgi:hypothetical protein